MKKINKGSLLWASYILTQKDNNNKKERIKSKSKICHIVSWWQSAIKCEFDSQSIGVQNTGERFDIHELGLGSLAVWPRSASPVGCHVIIWVLWYGVTRKEHWLGGIFPQMYNLLTLIMRKHHIDHSWETFNKIPDQPYSSKVSRSHKARKAWCYELQVCVPSQFTCWSPHLAIWWC